MKRKEKNKNTCRNRRARRIFSAAGSSIICLCSLIAAFSLILPGSISVYSEAELSSRINIPLVSYSASAADTDAESVKCTAEVMPASSFTTAESEQLNVEARLLGILPIGNIDVNVYRDIKVCPGGMSFGVKISTDGVLIVGMSDINTPDGKVNPAYEAGIRVGDVITKINGKDADSVITVTKAFSECGGKPVSVCILRDGSESIYDVQPVSDGGGYKVGIWVRDSTAGIGTVTYIVPETGAFAGLGHGIFDIDTGKLMPMRRGTVSDVIISGIKKGRAGAPGELQGYFGSEKMGTLVFNRESGVYGVFSKFPENVDTSELIPIGLSNDVCEGEAAIICSLDESGPQSYSIKISQISHDAGSLKNFVIQVTDPKLLEKTGGIVQGMSGSPVIQNGKLIGAVTHVMIGDPTSGYGIFIENMLKNSGSLMSPSS